VKNLPASVRQKLLNRSKSDQRPFNELLQYYAMERFLYRLSISRHSNRFVLKGALMLRVWESPQIRPTMDIDMLGKTSNESTEVIAQIREIIGTTVEPDGVSFDSESVKAEKIADDAEYDGIRILFLGMLDTARINMQIDIGFGDVVYPKPEPSSFPTLLDFPAPKLLCYSRESAIAEKFQAMIKLGELNSRMKDFYDIWLLARQFDFEEADLAQALRQTFHQRSTELPAHIDLFTPDFIDGKQIQWSAFRKRLRQDQLPDQFGEIVRAIDGFLGPVIAAGQSPTRAWTAPGPWITPDSAPN
jgi:predicted nucleotidyltransferase component of viral defense system